MDISHFITHIPDYHTHVYFKDIYVSTHPFSIFSEQNTNPSLCTGPQDLLVTHYDCEENEQKTPHKNVISQVSQCESEPRAIETTNVKQHYTQKSEQQHLQVINLQQHFPKIKYTVHKFVTEIKIDLVTNPFTRVT